MRARLHIMVALAGAALFAGCASLSQGDAGGTGAGPSTGSGTWYGAGGGGGLDLSAGTGGNQGTPYYNGSYSYLCGGSSAKCTPGTSDCTPGGKPGMSSGSGGDAGADESMISCQLVVVDSKVAAECNMVGPSNPGDPCESAAHCGAGLGCVTTTSGGVCRQYCCGNVEDCPADTYCAPLGMNEASAKIPVCTPVKKCKLLDASTCDPGQVCSIVRDDGTTSCIDEGPGKRGESCPCAYGYMCSKINTCLKLCHIGNDAMDCEGGACQGGVMGYPEGFGICVGYP